MRSLVILPLVLFACLSHAQRLIIGLQPHSPVQMKSATHSIPDVLSAATVRNLSGRTIKAYRIGWATISSDKTVFNQGPVMNLPAGVTPGADITVPAQNVSLNWKADEMVFYVAEVTFSDQSRWKADKKAVVASIR